MPNVAIPDRMGAALETGLADRSISGEDALFLMDEAPLGTLCEATSRVRDHFKGSSVRYSKKVFISLTHLCRDDCGDCTFRPDPQLGVAALHAARRLQVRIQTLRGEEGQARSASC